MIVTMVMQPPTSTCQSTAVSKLIEAEELAMNRPSNFLPREIANYQAGPLLNYFMNKLKNNVTCTARTQILDSISKT